MAAVFTTQTSLTVLMARTARLNLVAHPGYGRRGRDEIRLVGENFDRTVETPLQWDHVLTNLEKAHLTTVSSKGWVEQEESPMSGVMCRLDRVINWG